MAYKVCLYKIEQSVGKNGMNRFDDVKLVQSLLNFWSSRALSFGYPPEYGETNLGVKLQPLAVNGVCSENLINWIKVAQNALCGHKHPDGRVDPVDFLSGLGGNIGVKKTGGNSGFSPTHLFSTLVFAVAIMAMDAYVTIGGQVGMRQEPY